MNEGFNVPDFIWSKCLRQKGLIKWEGRAERFRGQYWSKYSASCVCGIQQITDWYSNILAADSFNTGHDSCHVILTIDHTLIWKINTTTDVLSLNCIHYCTIFYIGNMFLLKQQVYMKIKFKPLQILKCKQVRQAWSMYKMYKIWWRIKLIRSISYLSWTMIQIHISLISNSGG